MRDEDLFQKIEAAAEFIQSHTKLKPTVAVILGTGLGDLAKRIKKDVELSYEQIPHFPESTVDSHAGKLVIGKVGDKVVVAMEGRFHFYEGYSLEQVTFPVRVMRRLGAKYLFVSNAAGGLNLQYKKGDLILIEDQINSMGVNPLVGPNDHRLGIRFPDMVAPFSKKLMKLAEKVAKAKKIPLQRGVYVGVTGPCLETRAEYRMFREFADVIGMSTVPEVIVGVHAGFEILGVSIVTDTCDPDHLEPCDINEIIKTAQKAGPKLDQLFEAVIKSL